MRAREQLRALARPARERLRTLINCLNIHSSQAALTLLIERLSHNDHTAAQVKGILQDIICKAGFIEQRADAEMQDSGDQIRHGHHELENGKLPGLARFYLREGCGQPSASQA